MPHSIISHLDSDYILEILEKNQLLNEKSREWILKYPNFDEIAEALKALNKANLLNKEYMQYIKQYPNQVETISFTFNIINNFNILHEKHIRNIKNPNNFIRIAFPIDILKSGEVLNKENIKWALQHNDPDGAASALATLNKNGLLNKENIKWALQHKDPLRIAAALDTLNQNGLLNEKNIAWILQHNNPIEMASALDTLNKNELLNEENIKCTLRHNKSQKMAAALNTLNQNGLLNEENIELVMNASDSINIPIEIFTLNYFNLLNQENFNKLLNPDHIILFSNKRILYFISQIPDHLYGQDVFNQLIEYSRDQNPEQVISEYVNALIREPQAQAPINYNQSTHTSSIHQSASASAIKLNERYGEKISGDKLKSIIKEIKAFISSLSNDSQIHSAAKRCIECITQPDYIFEDPTSKITIQQLLALTYLALKDRALCKANEKDAMQLFSEGLYEIQRGYNLSEENIDDNEVRDKTICISGAFNKLLEKVNGVHPDVELIFNTKQLAALKLPIVVYEEIHQYLQERSDPESYSDFQKFVHLIEALKNEGVEVIWSEIEPKISKRLFDEFGMLYENNKNSAGFKEFVDAGKETSLTNLLSRYKKDLDSLSSRCQTIQASSCFFQNRDHQAGHDTENDKNIDTDNYNTKPF